MTHKVPKQEIEADIHALDNLQDESMIYGIGDRPKIHVEETPINAIECLFRVICKLGFAVIFRLLTLLFLVLLQLLELVLAILGSRVDDLLLKAQDTGLVDS